MTLWSKRKLAVYLAAIFAAGSVSGWVVATRTVKQKAFMAPRSDEIAASLRKCLHSKLTLTDDQKRKTDAIIERSSKEMQSIHKDSIERIRQALSTRNAQLAAVFTPEQQKQFEQLEKERQESWRGTNAWRNRGPGPGRDHWKGPERRKPSSDKRPGEVSTNNFPDPTP